LRETSPLAVGSKSFIPHLRLTTLQPELILLN
jgi:hypothetical protein